MKKLTLILLVLPSLIFCQKLDNIHVYHSDTTFFEKKISRGFCMQRPYEYYRLKNRIDNTYYFIYNLKNQLEQEGLYKEENIIGDEKSAGFYNLKYFNYKRGKLRAILYEKDGYYFKRELYKGKHNLKSIEYLNKKTGAVDKIEHYKNKKLIETIPYVVYHPKNTNEADAIYKKIYSYKRGKLYRIIYKEHRIETKREFYNGKNKLKNIRYYTIHGDLIEEEFFRKNKLFETRFYVYGRYYSIVNKCGYKCNSKEYTDLLKLGSKYSGKNQVEVNTIVRIPNWLAKKDKYVFTIKKMSDLKSGEKLEEIIKELSK